MPIELSVIRLISEVGKGALQLHIVKGAIFFKYQQRYTVYVKIEKLWYKFGEEMITYQGKPCIQTWRMKSWLIYQPKTFLLKRKSLCFNLL